MLIAVAVEWFRTELVLIPGIESKLRVLSSGMVQYRDNHFDAGCLHGFQHFGITLKSEFLAIDTRFIAGLVDHLQLFW